MKHPLFNPRIAWLLASLSLAAVLLIGGYLAYQKEFQKNRLIAEETAHTYELLVRNILSDLQRAIDDTAALYLRGGRTAGETRAILLQRKQTNPHLMDLLILDAQGNIAIWTGNGTAPDVKGRSYYRHHIEHPDSVLHVTSPQLSLVHENAWFFSLSKAVRDREGKLLGVGVAILSIEALEKNFDALQGADNLSVTLLHRNLTLIIRAPKVAVQTGSPLEGTTSITLTFNAPRTHRITSPLDGKDRIVSFRPLTEYDLFVTGSSNLDKALEIWRITAWALGGFWLFLVSTGYFLARWIEKSSEREAAQKEGQLRKFEDLTRSLPGFLYRLEMAPDGTLRFSYLSDGVKRVLGVCAADALKDALCLLDKIHPDDYDRVIAESVACGEQNKPWRGVFRMILADGKQLWIEAQDSPGRLEDGSIIWSGYANDVSDRVHLEESLRASEAKFRAYVESANDLIYALTPEGVLTYVSPNWTAVLGHEPSEVIGHSIAEYVHPDDLGLCLAFLEEIMRTGQPKSGVEYRVRHKDGQWRWHTSNGAPVLDQNKRIDSYVGIARDITDRKAEEQILKSFNKTLALRVEEEVAKRIDAQKQSDLNRQLLIQQSKLAELGNMIGAIAHQWKQPLNAVSLIAQELNDAYIHGELDRNELQTHIDQILKQVAFMSRTIDDFRSFYKPAKNKELFNPKTEVDRVIELLSIQIGKLGIDIEISGTQTLWVMGYPSEFKQVILNILNNAEDIFSDRRIAQPYIQINFSEADQRIMIAICDNGGGIPAELLPEKLFDPFVSTKGSKGTGIGLSLGRTIMQRMNGELEAYNTQEGACFKLVLPAAKD